MRNAILFALSALALASSAQASVVWKADFSTGNISQWSAGQSAAPAPNNYSTSRLGVTTSPPSGGPSRALKVLLKAGDVAYNYNHTPPYPLGNRSEVTRSEKLTEGMDRWYKWQIYIPSSYSVYDGKGGGATIAQFHHTSSTQGEPGSPPLLLVALTDSLMMVNVPYLNASYGNTLFKVPLNKGKWHTYVWHVKFSSNKSIGLVEFWDGSTKLLSKHTDTLFSGFTDYLKMGMYRRPTATPDDTIYIANVIEATSASDVGK